MTTVAKTLAGVLGASLLASVPAFANSDVDSEIAELRELMKGLQEKVEAQEEQIEHQSELLQDAQQVVREQQRNNETLSGIAEFWQAIDVNMSAAASYAYNFKKPDTNPGGGAIGIIPGPVYGLNQGYPGLGSNQGSNGAFYPFHGDHNTFQVDQVWIDIGKTPTEESRAGFQFSLLFGNTATALGQGGALAFRKNLSADSTSEYYVHQAYVSWLSPIANIQVDAGKFATLTGAEVADTTKNFNITNGSVYNLLQPIDHLGVLGSTELGPITLKAGVVNEGSLTVSSPDINKEKSYLAGIGFGTDMFSVGGTVLYGAEGGASGFAPNGDNEQKLGLFDFLATLEAGIFEAWLNGDYFWVEGGAASAWGVAAAGRLSLTEEFKIALRAEYARDRDSNTGGGFIPIFGLNGSGGPSFSHAEVYGVTGTVSYELAENLTLRGELRWDQVKQRLNVGEVEEFLTNTTGQSKDQVVGLAQIVYGF